MTYDNDRQLLPIGEFARATGLTTSALRFYADTGVLDPADTDFFSGYRLYAPSQISAGIRIRRLRAASMPLSGVRDVLSSSLEDTAEVIRRQITDLRASTGDAIAAAEQITDELTGDRQPAAPLAASSPTFTLAGPVLAAGLDSVLPTTVNEPELPVLGTVLVKVADGEMRPVATDRYRLAVRTFTLPGVTGGDWSGAVSAGALTAALPVWRRADQVTLHCAPDHLHAVVAGDTTALPLLPGDFPDYRLMLDALTEPVSRISVDSTAFRRAVEHAEPRVAIFASEGEVQVGHAVPDAGVTGSPTRAIFSLTTLYTALTGALGPDILLELRGPDLPLTVRSAQCGDLTSVLMPVQMEEN